MQAACKVLFASAYVYAHVSGFPEVVWTGCMLEAEGCYITAANEMLLHQMWLANEPCMGSNLLHLQIFSREFLSPWAASYAIQQKNKSLPFAPRV